MSGVGGPFHVGMSRNPTLSLMRHNGEAPGSQSFFAALRPWEPRALYGPYSSRVEAEAATEEVKKLKRQARAHWQAGKGKGADHPWVFNPLMKLGGV